MLTLNISATAHGLNYLPQYYADHLGLFADRGLAVTATAKDPWTGVLDDLDSRAADVALGGLWVPAMYAGTPRKLSVFAQVNHQFPKALVTRTPHPDFTWSDLIGKTVLAPGIGGSAPYAFTAGLVRESGVDPASITWLRDLSTPMYVELFEAGLGDAIVLDHTNAEAMQHRETGVIVSDYTRTGGLGPNSVYYCRTDRLEELSERLVAFTSALAESMQLLKSVGVDDVQPLLAEHWPTMPQAVLGSACTRMLNSQTWDTVRIDQPATERWMRILFEESMVRSIPAFGDVVDTGIVDAVESAAVAV
ncbi:ABC transporter substrate-binding protein [Mycolicibacterium sp. P9-64]|uniref:ABC transporter substrate-binding protein n=1 Tax=Mycolicibacterium sp. P9-64 TaxID=2024612 RepID=UPI0011EEC9C7|nr:ABC transporter substrate-binding protein [Mycolicibacterium sp. P9-64]KAA0082475.1 ABC transporter substrate-binding protein [Mycolicibacterium sp. P9-64]